MTDRLEAIRAVIKDHRKNTIERCSCGWSQIGKDHADHLAAAVEAGVHLHQLGVTDEGVLLVGVRNTLKIVGA